MSASRAWATLTWPRPRQSRRRAPRPALHRAARSATAVARRVGRRTESRQRSRIAMTPPQGAAFSPLEVDSPKTRAQSVLEAAQTPPTDAPEAAAEPAATAAAPPPVASPRAGWFGVVRSSLASPFTNAVALRDAPSELWVCFWCARDGAAARPRQADALLPRLEAIIALNYFVLSLILTEYLTLEFGCDIRRRQQQNRHAP